MSWLRSVFGSDGSPIIQYIVIFAVIFTVLAAIVFLVRRLTGGGTALQTRGARARQPRLGIVDVYELDRARQLILLRRDNVEHLLLVGGPNDVVVERNIQRGQRPLPESTLRPEPVAEPLPDPLAEAGRLPEPPRAIAETPVGRIAPAFEMPVVVPAPVPGSNGAPPVRLPLDAGLVGGDEPGRDLPASPEVVPPPAREPILRGRSQRPPVPASEPAPPPPVAEAASLPNFVPASVPNEPRSVDPEVLSNMARQLQAAIARPSSAVTPPPEPVAPPTAAAPAPAPTPVPPATPAAAAPSATALSSLMATFGRRPEASAAPAAPAADAPPPTPAFVLPPLTPPVAAPVPDPSVLAKAVTAPPPPPAPAEPAKPVAPPPIPKAPVFTPPPARPKVEEERVAPPVPARQEPAPRPEPARSETKAAGNPFSVEEIEAEFARLLGRPLDKQG